MNRTFNATVLVIALLSTNAFAMGSKLPKCEAPISPALLCGEVTDFCGPHFGACTTAGCDNSTPAAGAIYNNDSCVPITYTDKTVRSELQSKVFSEDKVCAAGVMSEKQTFSVSSVCGP
jgi:hypothetical protein